MTKTKITEDLMAEWVRLRQKGQSFRSIAGEYKVDPRTVQAWVQRASEEKEKEHWEAVSRQVDAKYLDEHYRLLLQAAVAFLDVVGTDPVLAPHERDAESFLYSSIESAVRQTAELLKGRGMNLELMRDSDRRAARIRKDRVARLSRKLLDALMEHKPQAKTAIDRWKSCWSAFQQARLELAEAAKNLFRQVKVPDAVAEALKWEAAREALESKLFGKEPCSSRVDKRDKEKATLIRYRTETERKLCKGSAQDMEAARNAYDTVLQQVSHEERVMPVVNAYHGLMDCVPELEDLVDRLVLMGKPRGRCPLCPNYSIHSSATSRAKG